MKPFIRFALSCAVLIGLCAVFSRAAGAQQNAQPVSPTNRAYDIARETVLEGTVLNYTAASTVPPFGARALLQTASGPVDVHLASARFLQVNHFSLNAGDSIRVVGESLSYGEGTSFVARVIQKGQQTLVIRSVRGFPLSLGGSRAGGTKPATPPAGVL